MHHLRFKIFTAFVLFKLSKVFQITQTESNKIKSIKSEFEVATLIALIEQPWELMLGYWDLTETRQFSRNSTRDLRLHESGKKYGVCVKNGLQTNERREQVSACMCAKLSERHLCRITIDNNHSVLNNSVISKPCSETGVNRDTMCSTWLCSPLIIRANEVQLLHYSNLLVRLLFA